MTRLSDPVQFRAKLKKSGACLVWTGAKNRGGYGILRYQGISTLAHRVAALIAGKITSLRAPTETQTKGFVLHSCDNPACCKPAHLHVGNYSDNQREAYARNRAGKKKGAEHANAKLAKHQVTEIRRRYRAGELQVPLAKEFGVSQSALSKIVRGETYV